MTTEKVQKIRFNNLDFILPDYDEEQSSICTIKQYQNGELSYAHLYRNTGKIMQYYKVIGTIDDIEFGEIIEIEMDYANAFAGLFGETWPFNQ